MVEKGGEKDILGGCVVSRTQYASLVSAIIWSRHFICRWRGVFSQRGGRGKECTFSLGLGGMVVGGRKGGVGDWETVVGERGMGSGVEVFGCGWGVGKMDEGGDVSVIDGYIR